MTKSVHLQAFPDVSAIDSADVLVQAMDRVRDICTAAFAVRDQENIRTRQPLGTLTVYGAEVQPLEPFADIIADELNVKQVLFSQALEKVAEHKLQVNFPVVGKRLGAEMKAIMPAVKQGNWTRNEDGLLQVAGQELTPEEYTLLLEPKGVEGAQAISTQDMMVVLDLELTADLKAEGLVRDVVRMVQQARKAADLVVSDRIDLAITGPQEVEQAVQQFGDYLQEQTLATRLHIGAPQTESHLFEETLAGEAIRFGFTVMQEKAA